MLVVASDRVAASLIRASPPYEQVARFLPYMGIGLQLPSGGRVDLERLDCCQGGYEEMQAEAEANGLDCHSFETVFGPPLEADLELTRLTAHAANDPRRSRISHSQASTTASRGLEPALRASRSRLSSNLRAQNSGLDLGRFG